MSPESSPSPVMTDLLARRSLAVIPRDQLRLLEQHDSWAVDFRDRPHGQAHIPGHVLETAKQAYRAKMAATRLSQDLPGPSPSRSVVEHRDQVEDAQVPASPAASARSGTVLSWKQSPDQTRSRQVFVHSSIVRETPKSAPLPTHPSPPRQRALHKGGADGDDGEGDDNDGDDDAQSSNDERHLDVALPRAQATVAASVNRDAARLAPVATPSQVDKLQAPGTPPPCAQPTQSVEVPATTAGEAKSPSPKPRAEGRRRHKMIELNDSPLKPLPSATVNRRMAAARMFVDGVISSNATSSSSETPATYQDPPGTRHVVTSIETSDHPVAPRPSINRICPGGGGAAAADGPSRLSLSSPFAPQVAQPASRATDPYRAFVAEYPDYVVCHGGSLWNFIRACVCLDYLRGARLLRECLFDDFIRAFSLGYLQYVARAGPGQEPLPAIEWFNLVGGAPLYNRAAVSGKTLDAILAAFPDEVRKARSIIRDDDDDEGDEGDDEGDKGDDSGDGDEGDGDDSNKGDDSVTQARYPEGQPPRVIESTPPGQLMPRPAHTPLGVPSAGRPEASSWTQREVWRRQSTGVLGGTLTPRPASPQLGSEDAAPSPAAPTPSASSRSERPRPSQWLSRLASTASSGTARKRSAEDEERLREHFRRRRRLSGKHGVASSR